MKERGERAVGQEPNQGHRTVKKGRKGGRKKGREGGKEEKKK